MDLIIFLKWQRPSSTSEGENHTAQFTSLGYTKFMSSQTVGYEDAKIMAGPLILPILMGMCKLHQYA